jgi:hypothetical protein
MGLLCADSEARAEPFPADKRTVQGKPGWEVARYGDDFLPSPPSTN